MDVSLGQVVYNSAVVADGEDTSSVIETNGMSLCGILIPATFTSTALTFQAALEADGPFFPIKNKSGAVSYTVAEGEYMAIDPSDFYGVQFLQIVCGSDEAAARTLVCSMKGI